MWKKLSGHFVGSIPTCLGPLLFHQTSVIFASLRANHHRIRWGPEAKQLEIHRWRCGKAMVQPVQENYLRPFMVGFPHCLWVYRRVTIWVCLKMSYNNGCVMGMRWDIYHTGYIYTYIYIYILNWQYDIWVCLKMGYIARSYGKFKWEMTTSIKVMGSICFPSNWDGGSTMWGNPLICKNVDLIKQHWNISQKNKKGKEASTR